MPAGRDRPAGGLAGCAASPASPTPSPTTSRTPPASWIPNDPGPTGQTRGRLARRAVELPRRASGVNAPEAWANLRADHRPGGRGVTVAILDTGVAYRNWNDFRKSPDFTNTQVRRTPTTSSPTTRSRSTARATARSSPGSSPSRPTTGVGLDRARLRRVDHAGARPRRRRHRRRRDDRQGNPLRGRPRRAGDQPQPRVRHRPSAPATSPTSSARSATPTATASWSWPRRATRASSRSPTRRGRPMR